MPMGKEFVRVMERDRFAAIMSCGLSGSACYPRAEKNMGNEKEYLSLSKAIGTTSQRGRGTGSPEDALGQSF